MCRYRVVEGQVENRCLAVVVEHSAHTRCVAQTSQVSCVVEHHHQNGLIGASDHSIRFVEAVLPQLCARSKAYRGDEGGGTTIEDGDHTARHLSAPSASATEPRARRREAPLSGARSVVFGGDGVW